jgi:hypothetical protein
MLRTMGQLTHSYGYGPAARDATPRLRHGPGPGQRLGDAMVTIDGQRRSVQEVTATPGMHLLLAGWPHDETHVSDLGWIQSHRLETLLDGSPGCGYYLVRPDGYIGLRGAGCDLGPVERFLREWR